ncbi:MAG: lipoate--protein ligase family protein [Candidatus Promineifilaceae bacterium]
MIVEENEGGSAAYPLARWRLINSGYGDGPGNMATDEAILDAVAAQLSPPTIRFYGWDPPCVSLGYRQAANVVDRARLASLGWDMVRRPTGGRAILHVDELTYSVVAPVSEPRVKGSILESYRRLSEALVLGLELLGLTTSEAPKDPSFNGPEGPACFDTPSNYEITHGGRKLVGSAQVRKKNVVLQHGTLPLVSDVGRLVKALHVDDEEMRQQMGDDLRNRATTLAAALGRAVSFEEAAAAMAKGFEQTLNLELATGQLTRFELDRMGELRSEKYAAESWAQRI